MEEPKIRADDFAVAKRYVQLAHRAARRDKIFTLSFSFFKKLLKRKTCFYTGIPFDDDVHKASVERVDNEKGYTPDNVVLVSEFYNMWKGSIDHRIIIQMGKQIEKHINK